MDTPKEETLNAMSYSELKKYAKKCGIKRNMKADKLIEKLLEKAYTDAEDSFVSMEQKIINSCKKNKEEKFNKDKEIVSDTPRRETYTLDCPSDGVMALNNELIISSASPVFRKTPIMNSNETVNVTMSRGSERKSKKRKVSFVTPMRRSVRLSGMTPHYASVKDRPKTPIPTRISSGKKRDSQSIKTKISFMETPNVKELRNSVSKNSTGRKERVSTPMPLSKSKRMNLSSSSLKAPIATPEVSFAECAEEGKSPAGSAVKKSVTICPSSYSKVKGAVSPKSVTKKDAVPLSLSAKSKRTFTPSSGVKQTITPHQVSGAKAKRTPVPNFSSLHQKAFDKMESIDEYQQRKAKSSAKKIKEQQQCHDSVKASASKKMIAMKNTAAPKKFSGIPFIPSVATTKDVKMTSFRVQDARCKRSAGARKMNTIATTFSKKSAVQGLKKSVKSISQENTPLKRRLKFDLQASLSKKLPYKPHTGPLKPLAEKNLNNSIACPPPQKAVTENKLLKAKRVESRAVLRGVRTNRRFELQMNNRKLASA